ncbi:hypothetical protein D1AOALGA4SA_9019 [Olavius algarvensis Delta 1 endosymbiont]|nr:hypothetical protein D1AOALGA4SA_9019 [Olavius algarvensis Delta 1 endosymbiont]
MLDVRCSTFIGFFSDQTDCPLAGGRAVMKHLKRTAEYRISNRRMSKGGIASLGLFIK